jgi:hypothetical protein
MKRSGWLTFAGVLLIVTGIMRILDSIWAFHYNGTPVDKLHGAVLGHSLTTYAVTFLIVGIISVVAGFLVMRPGSLSAEMSRRAGLGVAGFNVILAVSWLPYYPVWSLVYIGMGIIILFALLVHFDQETATD